MCAHEFAALPDTFSHHLTGALQRLFRHLVAIFGNSIKITGSCRFVMTQSVLYFLSLSFNELSVNGPRVIDSWWDLLTLLV